MFPDYSLPDPTGMVRTLSELQGRHPLILLLARGNYCPKEHHQHLELAANYPKVAVAYTRIVTISTDDHHTTQEFRASVGAEWTFLSDTARTTPAGDVVRDTAALTDRPLRRELTEGGAKAGSDSAAESARTLAAQIGRAAAAAVGNRDALQGADAVVLALRFTVLKGVIDEIAGPLTGKLVVVRATR